MVGRIPLEQVPGVNGPQTDRGEMPDVDVAELRSRIEGIHQALQNPAVRAEVDAVIRTTQQLHNLVRATAMQRLPNRDDPRLIYPRDENGVRDNKAVFGAVFERVRADAQMAMRRRAEEDLLTPEDRAQQTLLAEGAETYSDVIRRISGPLGEALDLAADLDLLSFQVVRSNEYYEFVHRDDSPAPAAAPRGRVFRRGAARRGSEPQNTPETLYDQLGELESALNRVLAGGTSEEAPQDRGIGGLSYDAGLFKSTLNQFVSSCVYLRGYPSATSGEAINGPWADVILGEPKEHQSSGDHPGFDQGCWVDAAASVISDRATRLAERFAIPRDQVEVYAYGSLGSQSDNERARETVVGLDRVFDQLLEIDAERARIFPRPAADRAGPSDGGRRHDGTRNVASRGGRARRSKRPERGFDGGVVRRARSEWPPGDPRPTPRLPGDGGPGFPPAIEGR